MQEQEDCCNLRHGSTRYHTTHLSPPSLFHSRHCNRDLSLTLAQVQSCPQLPRHHRPPPRKVVRPHPPFIHRHTTPTPHSNNRMPHRDDTHPYMYTNKHPPAAVSQQASAASLASLRSSSSQRCPVCATTSCRRFPSWATTSSTRSRRRTTPSRCMRGRREGKAVDVCIIAWEGREEEHGIA